jgi:PKD repeat protein
MEHQKFTKIITFLIFTLAATAAIAQNYCSPSYSGHGDQSTGGPGPNISDGFFTHIRTVSFANMKTNWGPPLSRPAQSYIVHTFDTAHIAKTATYPLTIFLGNGANPQLCAVWIDFNQNLVFEASERLYYKFDGANAGNHTLTTTITVPANAKTGLTRMRIGTRYGQSIPDPCTNNDVSAATNFWSQQFQDIIVDIQPATTQTFLNATSTRDNFSDIVKGSVDNVILGVEVNTNTNGVLNPLTASNFTFSTLGSTDPKDILKARLYYTGVGDAFDITTQVGSDVTSPNGTFKINANIKLLPGKNYFWLVYDVGANAILANDLSARCNGVEVSNIDRTPLVTTPNGSRSIGYCVSEGSQEWFINLSEIQMGSINLNLGTVSFNPYLNLTFFTDTLEKNTTDTMRLVLGNGYNPARVRSWIDWNRDGDFADAGEMVVDTFNFTGNIYPPASPQYPELKTGITVPNGAVVGKTRMRVSVQQRPVASLTPCTNPLDIGNVVDFSIMVSDSGQPVADFSAPASCLGNSSFFYDNSYTFGNYQINSWLWDFGDTGTNDTSSMKNPKYVYSKPGVYNVKLTVNTDKPGTAQTITKSVTVDKPIAGFSYTAPVYQTDMIFTDTTTGGQVFFWKWVFGDPQSGKLDSVYSSNPTHNFDTAGIYDVKLIVATQGGCWDTIIKTIKILEQQTPIADYTAATFNPYKGAPLNLLDQSLYTPKRWKWTVTPSKYTWLKGSNDSTQNPTISFDSLGTYTVFLEAINDAGSTTTFKSFVVKDYTKPIAWLSADPMLVKVFDSVSFIDSSANDPTSWYWNFGDSTGNFSTLQYPFYSYNKAGFYNISLKVANPAGTDSVMRSKFIEVTNAYVMCDNTATSSTALSGFIEDSGGQNDYFSGSNCSFTIKPPCAGKITITFSTMDMEDKKDYLQIFNGTDTLGKPLHPGAGFTGSSLPSTIIVDGGSIYVREITDAVNTQAGFAFSWKTAPNVTPKISLGNDSICYINSPLHIINTTSIGAGNSYNWDFDGDGIDDIFDEAQPSWTYSSSGYQMIRVIATNCVGIDTLYKRVKVIIPTQVPVVDFTVSKDSIFIIEDEIQFTDLSSNGPTSWQWEIDPPTHELYQQNTTDQDQNPYLLFIETGRYTVCLTATNGVGSSAKVCKENAVVVIPSDNMCASSSSDSAFGYISDDGGLTGNYQNGNPSCGFNINGNCAEEIKLHFKEFDFLPGDYLKVYDGTDDTGVPLFSGTGMSGSKLPEDLYAYSGNMYLEMITDSADNSKGFIALYTTTPGSKAKTKISFDVPNSMYDQGFGFFKNTSRGKNLTFSWLVDGSFNYTTTDLSLTGLSPGGHTISLTGTNCYGSTTVTKTISVSPVFVRPEVGFKADWKTVDTGQVLTLTDTSLNGPNRWKWDITPSSNIQWLDADTAPQIHLIFADSGLYQVCLRVENSQGADSTCKFSYIRVRAICRPSPSVVTGAGISKVKLNGDINQSNAYDSYTSYGKTLSIIERKGKYALTLEKNVDGQQQSWKAWIDWNNNGIYGDVGETVLNKLLTSNTSVTDTFVVPANAPEKLRMRVSASVSNTNTPCAVNGGEVEDYILEVDKDRTPPVITLLGNNPDTSEIGNIYIDPGATAWDAVDGNITNKIAVKGTVNGNVEGIYTLKYVVADKAGNISDTAIRTVKVTPDVSGPVIALTGKDTQKVEVFYSYVEQGYKAIDLIDGDRTTTVVVTGTVDTTKLGYYTLTYTASDKKNNIGTKNRIVQVIDTIKPVVTIVGSDTIKISCKDIYTESGATATDNYDATANVTASIVAAGTVNASINGNYTITYTATDASGNKGKAKRIVNVTGCPNAVEHVLTDQFVSLYPNPGHSAVKLEVRLPDHLQTQVKATIYNELGQQVLMINNIQSENMLDISKWSNGIYLIYISSQDEQMTLRLIKQ